MPKKAPFTTDQVQLTAEQFGFLKPEQFEEVIKKIANASEVPIICSCGRCMLDKAGAAELEPLLRKVAQINVGVNKISEQINCEEYYINLAASGQTHVAEISEEHLRGLQL